MWTYKQTTGELFHNGQRIAQGYSGHEAGLNNPEMHAVPNIGPIPRGEWTIDSSYDHPDLGPVVMNLLPRPSTETFGRTVFRIHGDTKDAIGKKLASHGCLVFAKHERLLISDSTDRDLEIIL